MLLLKRNANFARSFLQTKQMQILEFDTVIIGSGLAGLSAAYHSAKNGSVAIVTKSELDTSNSYFAQGGIAAAISNNDSPEEHALDTLVTGRGICDHDAVNILVNEGKTRVLELIKEGMTFDKKGNDYVLGLEGGHKTRRILHAGGDATGKGLTCFKLGLVKKQKNIHSFDFVAAIKLLHKNNCITGVQAYDFNTNKNIIFKSKAVILATGGLSRVFTRSTNPHTATGDGIALAYEAGAKIADLEFIQFHPSALCLPNQDAYLISEAVRGEGAWLLNNKGERFMKDIHPLAELAPRDVVAYSIFRQMQESGEKHIYLSLKHLDKEKIRNRFKNIDRHLKEHGYNLAEDLIPVAPAAHYLVGGVRTSLDAETNISGLFACGEVASTGVMGANRLASNSLLECLVFGKRASDKANKLKPSAEAMDLPAPIVMDAENEELFLAYKNELASLMSKNLGIVRNKESMEHALLRFTEISEKFSKKENKYNLIKIRNAANICKLIATSALVREESRGGHIREDFPKENPHFKKHIIQQKNKNIHFELIRE